MSEDIAAELIHLAERVSLLEVTRPYDKDARPTHVVQSKYHIIGEKGTESQIILRAFFENTKNGDHWKEYSATLKALEEVLSPKVAKELLDAFMVQNEMY